MAEEHIHISSATDDEELYLKHYKNQTKDYELPAVALDLLIFSVIDNSLKIILHKRENQPYKGMLALPGVFVGYDEPLYGAVKRCLKKEVGDIKAYFEQLYTFGNDPKRDPRMRIFSVAYFAFVNGEDIKELLPTSDFYDVDELLSSDDIQLAFDHLKILKCARRRIKERLMYSTMAFSLLPDEFTLPQLQKVYEILLEKKLYKTNFRAKVMDLVIDTGKKTEGDAFRPSVIYTKNDRDMLDAHQSFKSVDDDDNGENGLNENKDEKKNE